MVCPYFMVQHIGKYLPCVRLLPLLQINSRLVGQPEVTNLLVLTSELPVIRPKPERHRCEGSDWVGH